MTIPTLHSALQTVTSGLLLGGLFALTALGLSLVLGVMRLVNLVHGDIVVIGSYLAFMLLAQAGIDPLLAVPLVFAIAAAAAYPAHRGLLAPLSRQGPEAPLLTTFALSIIAQNLLIRFFSGDTRSLDRGYTRRAIHISGLAIPEIYLIGFLISLCTTVLLYLLMSRSGFGRRLRASAEDPEAAAVVGVAVGRVHAITYGLGGGLAAAGGVLVALCFSFTPTSGTDYLLTGFAVVVLGGLGNVAGTFAGGVLLGLLQSAGATFFGDGYRQLVGLILLLVILAMRPQGLFTRRVLAL